MTQHSCTTITPGCYRCELSQDEMNIAKEHGFPPAIQALGGMWICTTHDRRVRLVAGIATHIIGGDFCCNYVFADEVQMGLHNGVTL